MAKTDKAAPKKAMSKSLTIQSAVALALLILAKALLPVFTELEVPDEVFESLCGILGLGSIYGLRRALPILIVGLLPLGLMQQGCGASICQKASIEITAHPTLPSPAGTVTVKCDGIEKAVLIGKEVKK
jgi:hypothetical protein